MNRRKYVVVPLVMQCPKDVTSSEQAMQFARKKVAALEDSSCIDQYSLEVQKSLIMEEDMYEDEFGEFSSVKEEKTF